MLVYDFPFPEPTKEKVALDFEAATSPTQTCTQITRGLSY